MVHKSKTLLLLIKLGLLKCIISHNLFSSRINNKKYVEINTVEIVFIPILYTKTNVKKR